MKDDSVGTLIQWIIENEGKETLPKYLSAIEEDESLTLTPEKGRAKGKIIFKGLHYGNVFNGLALRFAERNKESSFSWDLETPTMGETKRCVDTAMKLIPVLQGKLSEKLG